MREIAADVTALNDSDDMKGKYLTFWSDTQFFGVPIADVVQIVGLQKITEIPDYPPYAKGVIDLRGSIIPLIDMRLRLGRAEQAYTDRTCIIVTNIRNRDFGFIVDAVDAVTNIDDEWISEPPHMGGDATTNRYLTGVGRLQKDGETEKIVLLINTAKVLGEEEFNALADAAQ